MHLGRLVRLFCCAVAVIIAGSPPAAGASGSGGSHCPDKNSRAASSFVREHGGVCYEFHVERCSWKTANTSCTQRRGSLVMIDSEAKQEFLAGVLKEDPAFDLVWVGASFMPTRGTWRWERTGQPLKYNHWTKGHPRAYDDGCASMARADSWQWQSLAYCEGSVFSNSYICQYDERSSGGLLSNPGDIIGLAVGLSCAFVIILTIGGVLAWIHKRRRLRAERQRSYSSSSEQKISNVEGGLKCELNSLNKCSAPPAYGQVTTLGDTSDGCGRPQQQLQSDVALLLLQQQQQSSMPLQYEQQLQQQLQSQLPSLPQQLHQHDGCPEESDPLVSNLACHSSQASKLHDKCLLELIAQDRDPPSTSRTLADTPHEVSAIAAAHSAVTVGASAGTATIFQPATPSLDAADRAVNGVPESLSTSALTTEPGSDSGVGSSTDSGRRLRLDQNEEEGEENEEAVRLLRYNDLN